MWKITAQALEFIYRGGGTLTVGEPVTVASCCLNYTEPPEVRLGKPQELQKYKRLELDGVVMYVPRYLLAADLVIDLKKFLWHCSLVIEGWKII